mgnify:FL=1
MLRKKHRKLLVKRPRTNALVHKRTHALVHKRKVVGIKGAYTAGRSSYKTDFAELSDRELQKEVNVQWWRWYAARKAKRVSWRVYHASAARFIVGFLKKGRQINQNWVMLPTGKKVAAILCVMNEQDTIRRTLDQLGRFPLEEIFVIVNGSTDQSFHEIKCHPAQPTIIHYDPALGYDVGRAIGAKASNSDILLFLDGDMMISAKNLVPFVHAIQQGADLALNNITPFLARFNLRDTVTIVKQFVNKSLGRGDLVANSLTAIPHALSRRAVETIGFRNLTVPPLAQAIALRSGLKVNSPASINVIRKNRIKVNNFGVGNAVEGLIIGDHLEALHYSMSKQGKRLALADRLRKRKYAWGCAQ